MNPNKYNAKKTTHDGVDYDSKLEAAFAQFCDKHDIPYLTHVKFELQESFHLSYKGQRITQSEAIRPITYEADFVIGDKIIVDIKGNKSTQTEQFNIKWKMLKNKFRERYIYLKLENQLDFFTHVGMIKLILEEK